MSVEKRIELPNKLKNNCVKDQKSDANPLKSVPNKNKKHTIIRRIWIIHFLIGLTVVLSGIYLNGGNKKYVPVDVKKLSKEVLYRSISEVHNNNSSCLKAYVNVHADSLDEHGAIICCRSGEDKFYNNSSRSLNEEGTYESLLCTSKLSKLPFASTLTRIRDSWLFPLIPLLLRIVITASSYLLCQDNNELNNSEKDFITNALWWSSWRRLFIYFLIMNFRGWGLYIFLNMIQDSIPNINANAAASLFSFTSTFMTKPSDWALTTSSNNGTCWYQNLLRSKNRHKYCYGRSFDFSDHMVLFFGQTLPVMLFEILFCVFYPFWKHHHHYHQDEEYSNSTSKMKEKDFDSSSVKYAKRKNYHITYKIKHVVLPWVIMFFLLFLFLYFNFITLIAAHKTAAYFHTPGEIMIGYFISLIIQLPLGFLICFYSSTPSSSENQFCYWTMIRQFIGLQLHV